MEMKVEDVISVFGTPDEYSDENFVQILSEDGERRKSKLRKTLAAQIYGEFKEFFPENAVEYFVSYYGRRKDSTIYCI